MELTSRPSMTSGDGVAARSPPTKTTFDHRWSAFKRVYESVSPVKVFHGTTRQVGMGMLKVAEMIWQENPEDVQKVRSVFFRSFGFRHELWC